MVKQQLANTFPRWHFTVRHQIEFRMAIMLSTLYNNILLQWHSFVLHFEHTHVESPIGYCKRKGYMHFVGPGLVCGAIDHQWQCNGLSFFILYFSLLHSSDWRKYVYLDMLWWLAMCFFYRRRTKPFYIHTPHERKRY